MRVIFMGTPEFAVPVLDALVDAGHDVVAAYSQPPRAGGRRGKALTPSPVQARAEALGIAVRTPLSFRKDPDALPAFQALEADVAVVAAYGLILPQAVLDAPRHGCLNVHGSLLPRWRGAAPVQRAILAGDTETGIGIMQMEAGLDTGPVRLEERIPIGPSDTSGVLSQRLSLLGAKLMVEVLGDLAGYPPQPQPEDGVTYAAKIDKAEARIDWSVGAQQVDRQVRAFNPAPGAWFEHEGERIKLLTAHVQSASDNPGDVHYRTTPGLVLDAQLTIGCGDGAIRPDTVQRAGRGVMTVTELLRGFPIPPGIRL
ncbi:methionyl-tRNA formyltransferase [Sphingomonas kyeonggiensis]|uniref:methionyl-tRNA formyltransferase n=1 Tax=Sphingomonas kyeonggiensis TaxID=1268553 RepID=UPI0027823FD5|nr:methionyl-tRNA formyltransferase [Sphingomonas kyeonggiensis]MDQ0251291.1 methionyl-tRNA formyltransferase [Sphingomonas kyeonggiensis]